MSILGLIILSGIAVNNSILFLSEILNKKNVVKAVLSRTEPILITTLTTIIGSLPMIMGYTNELRKDLALTIIGGMFFSIGVSLLLLPAIYSFFKRNL
jgi:HAE1 family hydrophobic/amphiphilic exporter-1